MPAHSCIAIWFGPEKSPYAASTEISFKEASGPENEKSNLRLPSLRAWNPRYRIVDFGSFINVSHEAKFAMVGLLQFGKYFCLILSSVERIKLRVGSKRPAGIRGICPSIPFARFWSMRAYSMAYSWATMSEIPLQ